LFNPVIAAKEIVTADHIGNGRFGLNLVVGWNEGEFEMFGVEQREHEARYEYAQEWLDVMKTIWSPKEDFDFEGRFFSLKGIRGKPKPIGGVRPLIMNAGASDTGRAFAVRNCDAFFLQASRLRRRPLGSSTRPRSSRCARARDQVYTVGDHLPAHRQEAEEYYRHVILDNADFCRHRPHPGDEEHHTRDERSRGVRAAAPLLRQRNGRPSNSSATPTMSQDARRFERMRA
jgi:alkanesulfonate monooxygenase SsuD/methylene tetrahydromethanopterin reductase-like flavin-dependent oxidoreductase (luciferase family)